MSITGGKEEFAHKWCKKTSNSSAMCGALVGAVVSGEEAGLTWA